MGKSSRCNVDSEQSASSQPVGKTSMILRYLGKGFSLANVTMGASYFPCKISVDDAQVKLQVWDTAGQERFRCMAPMFYRKASADLLVFDIAEYDTFQTVKTWVTELQRNVEELMVLNVVGNKSDLEERRQVTREEAVQYANSIGGNYFEASALHNQGIEDVFLNTAKCLVSLSEGHSCPSLRVYDSSRPAPPRSVQLSCTSVRAGRKRVCC